MNKSVMKCIRIDQETNEYISFLKSRNVRYTDIIFPIIKDSLRKKCLEFKLEEKQVNYPF